MSDARLSATDVVVAVGSSAGGLPALREFLSSLPSDPSITPVLVQHQAPDRKSALIQLLGRATDRPFIALESGTRLQRGAVHVAARTPVFQGDVCELQQGEMHVSIDHFFRSVAEAFADRAVGVVLSGSGSDGTAGLLAIKREGGLTLVQDPATAAHDGMPSCALRHGAADLVGTPELLARRVGEHAAGGRKWSLELADDEAAPAVRKLLQTLRERTGHDFSRYKSGTIRRRIARRMAVHRISTLDEYLLVLKDEPHEADALFSELLIGVTRFFRDATSFDELNLELHQLVRTKDAEGASLRIWVPGCSTGEEAYSIAMLVCEAFEATSVRVPVSIFSTDIDPVAIEAARTGVFSNEQIGELPEELLAKYFVPAGDAMRIRPWVREMLIFAAQSLLADPPFMHLDLISCRNVLIYLNQTLQDKLLPLFHYALDPEGLLFLGSSEGVGGHSELFEPLSTGSRVFRRLDRKPTRSTRFPVQQSSFWHGQRHVSLNPPSVAANEYRRALLAELPPSIVVDGRGQIVYVHGHVGPFLEPAEGVAGLSVVDMARRGLRVPIATALRRLEQGESHVVLPTVSALDGEHPQPLELRVRRVNHSGGMKKHAVLVFAPRAPSVGEFPPERDENAGPTDGSDSALERELRDTREQLESALDALNSSNDELQSANEELQSANEELQSANEELETSREETLSLNEELRTVNVELESRVQSMERANDDLVNLLDATDIATIFVNDELVVRRFTQSAQRVIRLKERDIGRPLQDVATHLVDVDLAALAGQARNSTAPMSLSVRDGDMRRYRLRLAPYTTSEGLADGVVITLVDDTEWANAHGAARLLLEDVAEPMLLLDADLCARACTGGATRLLGVAPATDPVPVHLDRKEDEEALRSAVGRALEHEESLVVDIVHGEPGTPIRCEISPAPDTHGRGRCALLRLRIEGDRS